jgi:hypothetical protein
MLIPGPPDGRNGPRFSGGARFQSCVGSERKLETATWTQGASEDQTLYLLNCSPLHPSNLVQAILVSITFNLTKEPRLGFGLDDAEEGTGRAANRSRKHDDDAAGKLTGYLLRGELIRDC